MKKVLSILLALILVLSSTAVFAAGAQACGTNGKENEKGYYNKYDKKEENSKSINALKNLLQKQNNRNDWFNNKSNQNYMKDIINRILELKTRNNDQSTIIFINGKEYASGSVIKYKNFQIPTGPITKGLGAKVNWDSKKHIITITKESITLVMNLETNKVTLNGSEMKTNILKTSKKNKTIVLIKFIFEVFGKNAQIDEDSGAVIIEDDGSLSINDNVTGKGLNRFEYSKKWSYGTQASAFLEDNHWSADSGAYYTVKFNGTQIKLYGATAPNHGIAAVSIDNGTETLVDFYSAQRADNTLVYTSPVLSNGQHVLKVRVTGTKNTSSQGSYVTADRVNVQTDNAVQDGTNLALNKYSFADSQQTDNTAAKGNDGSASTRWCAADGALNHWWTVDLGAAYNLSGSQVTWEKAGKIYKYKVEVSSDNSNWTVKADRTGNTAAQQQQTDSFAAQGVRFVRISVTGLESDCWASISEFKVFGTGNTVDTQPPEAPNGLVVTTPSAYEAVLNWNASADNTGTVGYKIYRNGNLINTVTSGTSYRDTGLSAGTVYVYSVIAYDVAGNNSNYSSLGIITTPASNTAGNGLTGKYYNNKDFTDLKLTRVDETVNAYWNNNSPDSSMDKDTFSVRWTGQIQPLYSETYTFHTTSDDGVRLWVNGTKLIDNWTDHSAAVNSGSITLTAGQKYDIQLEYYNNSGEGKIMLEWSSASQAKQVVPKSQLYSSTLADYQAPTAPTGLTATGISASQISLSWTAATDNTGVTGYKVYRNSNFIGAVSATTYSDTGLAANTAYTYTIQAYDGAGNISFYSLPASAYTKPAQAGTNLAYGKTASSDSEETGNTAAKGNDGSLTSRWCAADGGFNHWWKVDLGGSYNLTGTEIVWEKVKAYKYKIEVSADGSNWTLSVDRTGNTNAVQTQSDNFTANSVRYVKITVTGFDSDCWASFYEFRVF